MRNHPNSIIMQCDTNVVTLNDEKERSGTIAQSDRGKRLRNQWKEPSMLELHLVATYPSPILIDYVYKF